MNKVGLLVLAVAVVAAFGFAGCSSTDSKPMMMECKGCKGSMDKAKMCDKDMMCMKCDKCGTAAMMKCDGCKMDMKSADVCPKCKKCCMKCDKCPK